MTEIYQPDSNTELLLAKLKDSLDTLSSKLERKDSGQIATVLAETLTAFRKFFTELGQPSFTPELIVEGDLVDYRLYNDNLRAIYNDIVSFYKELKNLEDSQVASYNYSQVVVTEIINRANAIAGTVLDLNILNNYTRGDVIVAGDDFKNLDFIDKKVAIASNRAELLLEGGGITLARAQSKNIVDGKTTIKITPLSPASADGSVTTEPTPGNFKRFYEGDYYNFLGAARPEGGKFNIKFYYDQDKADLSNSLSGQSDPTTKIDEDKYVGTFIEYGASEEQKEKARRRMFDNNPATFWECEYVYKVQEPLVSLDPSDTGGTQTITIDLKEAEKNAQQYDYAGRDLGIEIVVTFPEPKNVNMVVLNPILFGADSFPYVREVATADDNNGLFEIVDGWNSLKFPKTITPEANEYLTDSQLGVTLSPNRYQYSGKGVYPFPTRNAKKVRIIVVVDNPVPQPYEKIYMLLNKTITTKGTITTTTKEGLLGGLF